MLVMLTNPMATKASTSNTVSQSNCLKISLSNMGYACALAWFLFVIIMILTAIIMKSQNKWVYYGGD